MTDLPTKLRQIRSRIGRMCARGEPPSMSVPASRDDDDLFICDAAEAAADEIERLRKALLPFAKNADFYKPDVPFFEFVKIPLDYLRAARAVMPGELPPIEDIIEPER